MSTIDIRDLIEEEKITEIIFADSSDDGARSIKLDTDGDLFLNNEYVLPQNVDNLIKALKKAKALGWFEK